MLSITLLAALFLKGEGLVKNMDLETDLRINQAFSILQSKFNLKNNKLYLVVDPNIQKMFLMENRSILSIFTISTGKKGMGCKENSFKTPFGAHVVKEKIGDDAPLGTIFKARKNTHKIAKIFTNQKDVSEDFVTTRILRLAGLEEGVNKGRGVDSYSRFIYIHGTPEEGLLGTAASHGCIRMKNFEVIELYNKIPLGTLVYILDK